MMQQLKSGIGLVPFSPKQKLDFLRALKLPDFAPTIGMIISSLHLLKPLKTCFGSISLPHVPFPNYTVMNLFM